MLVISYHGQLCKVSIFIGKQDVHDLV